MGNETDRRMKEILAKKARQNQKADDAAKAAERREIEILQRKTDAPARWVEQWKLFGQARDEINSGLASGKLRVEFEELPRSRSQNEISMFQIFVFEDGKKLDSFYTCTISELGNLSATRRLPNLYDTASAEQSELTLPRITAILLNLVDSATGGQSQAQMRF
jgi:hypothetical protein